MAPLHKEFYRLDELAERWQQTENNLLQMAAGGQISLSCFFRGKYKGVICKLGEDPSHAEIEDRLERLEEQPDRLFAGYFVLPVIDAKEIAVNCLYPGRSYKTNQIQIAEADWRLAKGDWLLLSDTFQYSIKDIMVLAREVERVEATAGDREMVKAFPLAQYRTDGAPDDESALQDDLCAEGNNTIEDESGMSFNTFKKYADLAGIVIGKTEGNNPKNKILKSDIRRVVRFKKNY